MTRVDIRDLVLGIVERADYDLYKSLDPSLAEDPEDAADQLEELIDFVEDYLNN